MSILHLHSGRLLTPLLFLIVLLTSGCITVDTALTLNPDGSGNITIHEVLTASGQKNIHALKQNGTIPDIDITGYFNNINNNELAAAIPNYTEGLTFTTIESNRLPDGSLSITIAYSFNNINDVKFYTTMARQTPLLKFKYTKDELTISTKINEKDRNELERTTTILGSLLSSYANAFQGMNIQITLTPPAIITQSNAHFLNPGKDTVTFLNIDIGKLIATPAAINTLIEFQNKTSEELSTKLLPFEDWLKLETQESITLKLQQIE